jgi:hypothetical protein
MPAADACIPLVPEDRLGTRAWLTLLLGSAALVLLTYVTEPSVFSSLDWLRVHVYYKEYLAAAVSDGRLPLWNPHVALGRPFAADPHAAFFYPPTALYLFFKAHVACALWLWIHLTLLLYGVRKLAVALGITPVIAWIAAFVFASSAPVVGAFSTGLVNHGAALCYAPLIFWLVLRVQAHRSVRRASLLALVLGLQMLLGHPQPVWLTCLGAGWLVVGRRLEAPWRPALKALSLDLLALVLAILAAAAMAAIVLLPLGELAAQSNRQTPSLAFAGAFAMTFRGWLTLVSPTDPHIPSMAEVQLYAGVLTFLTAPIALVAWRQRESRALALLLVVAALLAAGNTTPVFRILYYLVPGLSAFRIHSRAAFLVTLVLVLAAGLFFSRPRPRWFVAGLLPAALLAAIATWATSHLIVVSGGPAHAGCARSFLLVQGAVVLSTVGLVAWWARRQDAGSPRSRRAVVVALAALVLLDLQVAGFRLRQEHREKPADAAAARLAKALGKRGLLLPGGIPPRIAVPRLVFENSGMRYGWSSFTGYVSLMLGRVWNYIYAGIDLPVPTEQVVYPAGEILERGPFAYNSMNLQVGAQPQTNQLLVNTSPDPRAYLTNAAMRVRDHREATVRMRDGHPFHQVALIEQPIPPELAAGVGSEASGKVEIASFEPERIRLRVDSPGPAILVLAEPWYPGWRVSVGGSPGDCFPVNAWMRGTLVPAGKNEVIFTYRSTYLALGAVISAVAFALLLALSLRRGRAVTPS